MAGRALLCTTEADGATGARSARMKNQYARAASTPRRPIIGRNTNGGFVITSSPLPEEGPVSAIGEVLGLEVGDADADGEADGDGEAVGVGVGDAWSVKFAQGFGGTLAQSLCGPGLSPGNGVTTFVKLPLESVVTLAATRESASQYRLMDSLGRNEDPVAVILVLEPPAAVSSTMLAPSGVGVGVGHGPLAGQPAWIPARAIGEMARRTPAAAMAPRTTLADVK